MSGFDWDAWRAGYAGATYRDQQAFHADVFRAFPEQAHYDAGLVALAVSMLPGSEAWVVELGGWDGALGQEMLERFPRTLARWTNVELCRQAVGRGLAAGRDARYEAPELRDWYWTTRWRFDLLVASHVIEHLSAEHLELVVAATDARALFFDAPLDDEPSDWRGFTGTHVLEVGWDGVDAICARHGYLPEWTVDHETDSASGGEARARLYKAAPRRDPRRQHRV